MPHQKRSTDGKHMKKNVPHHMLSRKHILKQHWGTTSRQLE